MADRFPLIIDNSAEKIKELVSGDNLDLTKSNLKNADYIQSAGVNVAGVATATSLIGDGSQLTNLPPSGGSLTATASGTLADGSKVIINTDGTVSAVSQSAVGWVASLGSSGDDSSNDIEVDSSSNVHIVGRTASYSKGCVLQLNSSGVIQWERNIGSSNSQYYNAVSTDSSGNVYTAGRTNASGQGGHDFLIAKYNSSGTEQWQITFGTNSPHTEEAWGIDVDSSGNVYVSGQYMISGTAYNGWAVAKFNSSGSLQWQRYLYSGSGDYAFKLAYSSQGDVYVCGQATAGQGGDDAVVAKFDGSSGNLIWQRGLGASSTQNWRNIAIDSSNNIYLIGSDGANSKALVAKYNSSGTIQWQKHFGHGGWQSGFGIAIDSSDKIYISGTTDNNAGPGGGASSFMAKLDTSGNLEWQRSLGSTQSDGDNTQISVDDNHFYVTTRTASGSQSGDNILVAKLPVDGSGAGSYGDFTYAEESGMSMSTSSLTAFTSSLSNGTPSLTRATSSLTDAAGSMTSSSTNVTSINLTSENYIGVSNGAYSNGQTATIQIMGAVDDAQSSLTPGQAYYVQGDGTLSETADSPSVFAGTAIAATKLIVRG